MESPAVTVCVELLVTETVVVTGLCFTVILPVAVVLESTPITSIE